MEIQLTKVLALYMCLLTAGGCVKVTISTLYPPGILPAWILPGASGRAGWRGVCVSCWCCRPWCWAASLQAGVHCAGTGNTRPSGLLANQQIPLPLHQREHAAASSLQHGEVAERWRSRPRPIICIIMILGFLFIADSEGPSGLSRVRPGGSRVLSADQPPATTT